MDDQHVANAHHDAPGAAWDDGWSLPGPPAAPARKGRGATLSPPCRFDHLAGERADDGWGTLEEELAEPPRLETTLTRDATRSIIARNESPDIGFDRSINPYRGCEHGCIYCYARPSHAHLGLSPGLDFETKLLFKPEAATLLARELSRPGYRPAPIALGSNTDPYQPVERQLKLTRAVLEVLAEFNHPCTIVTKSALVARDIDILAPMAERRLVRVCLSVTTLDRSLANVMEPRAATPSRRLQAIEALSAAGIPTAVLAAPMIPGLNDAEMERILEAGARAGATAAGYILLRLPHELREMFTAWLEAHYPGRAARVLALIRQTRAGALNDARFGSRFTGSGVYADMLARRFAACTTRLGLSNPSGGLDSTGFRVPQRHAGKEDARQLALL
ncbi:PA0069 family radical SAM protein [Elioraea rosea]|uniref:PA0069 family radical SAM protein n=1 Tax=Elioraea rosea TaxID=2492390 RepID=UPI001186C65C|nr:PA0069 family radical SAM protein [Elioraea rosea]